jgi:UDPglucose 6-dehydrogenase
VLISVPTPTTKDGFSYEYVIDALRNLADGTTAVVKSTILPGTTEMLQKKFPNLFVFHSPEFLLEATAAYNAANPERNIVGIPEDTDEAKERAEEVLSVLPKAPYQKVMPAVEAEMVKYIGNCFLYSKVVMMNIFHDMVSAAGGDWSTVREAVIHDARIGKSHTEPVHVSGHDQSGLDTKRGAGGHCFIKDFEAFRRFYGDNVGLDKAHELLTKMIAYNNHLLISTGKDIELLEGVYGHNVVHKDAPLK